MEKGKKKIDLEGKESNKRSRRFLERYIHYVIQFPTMKKLNVRIFRKMSARCVREIMKMIYLPMALS